MTPSAELRRAESATWGPRPGDRAATAADRRVVILSWKPNRKSILIGFATVRLPSGLILYDCPIFLGKGGDARAVLPTKPIVNSAGALASDGGAEGAP
jgi:hypothetical protein